MMMFSTARWALPLLGLSSFVHSFPTPENAAKLNPTYEELHKALLQLREKRVVADGSWKPIDVSGQHAFQPPNFAAGDQRGPCPGLNSLANHGYLPRDGIASFAETIVAVNQVFGMGIDLGTVIATMGVVYSGNPLSLNPSFSLDGPSDKVNNLLGNALGLIGKPRGVSFSHNFIEADGSNTRDDLYVTGDAATMNMTAFVDLYNSIEGDAISFDQTGARIVKRIGQSIATNPYYYSGPYTGMLARNAGYAFALRLLSNHSAEHPEGQLTRNVLKSLFAVSDDPRAPSGMVYKRGHEQIPENWYRIPSDYGLLQLNIDLIQWYIKYPTTLSIGGNMGKVNSFVGLDFGNITGGVLNAANILEGNGLMCFTLEFVKTFAPNSLSTLFNVLATPLGLITDAVASPLLSLACPEFKDLAGGDDLWNRMMQFPGASKAGSAL